MQGPYRPPPPARDPELERLAREGRVPVYRNHRLPAHVHAVIDQVLVALHRSHPMDEATYHGIIGGAFYLVAGRKPGDGTAAA